MTRWKKPPKSPQLGLNLRVGKKAVTDTMVQAADGVGALGDLLSKGIDRLGNAVDRFGDQVAQSAGELGDLAAKLVGSMRQQRDRRVQKAVSLAATVRGEVLDKLRELGQEGATADELAVMLKRSPFTTRPRCTELGTMGLIHDSGRRRKNVSGRNAIVWVIG